MLHNLAGATIQIGNLVNYNCHLLEDGKKLLEDTCCTLASWQLSMPVIRRLLGNGTDWLEVGGLMFNVTDDKYINHQHKYGGFHTQYEVLTL